jgi:hypothetical protein
LSGTGWRLEFAKDAVMAMGEEGKRWIVEFQNGQRMPAVADNPWLPTTKNYLAADAVAKSASQLKLKWLEWTRVFDMLREWMPECGRRPMTNGAF